MSKSTTIDMRNNLTPSLEGKNEIPSQVIKDEYEVLYRWNTATRSGRKDP